MPAEAIWTLGFLAAISVIQLTKAWELSPRNAGEHDKPLNRVLINALGWAVLTMSGIFAVYLNGLIIPPLVMALIWWALTRLRKRFALHQFYVAAAPLGVAGMVVVVILFQIIFGDNFFGLANIFPED